MDDRKSTISKIVGLCQRVPGSTQWNAAEWMYDEMTARAALAAQPAADPCPACQPGVVCKTPACGRLKAAQPTASAEPRCIGEIVLTGGHPRAVLSTGYDENGNHWAVGTKIYAAPVTALAAQPAASAEPSDLAHEIWAAAQLTPGEGIEDGVARIQALLSRYDRPAGDAQPVAWTTPDGREPISDALKRGRPDLFDKTYTVPLYAAPLAAQKADDARDAVLPEAPTDALLIACGWEQWRPEGVHVDRGEATRRYRAIREAAIAQQRKGE